MKKATCVEGKPAIDLLEEAIAALRQCGFATWLCYYVGTVPFVLALLYFWSEMSAGAYAEEFLASAALGMSVAFIWMKCWQSIFANRLLVMTGAQEPISWTPGRIFRLVVQQTFIQSTALLVLPVAAIVTLPFGWTYAFYQNFLIDGSGEPLPVRTLADRSIAQSKLWTRQNHVGIVFLFLCSGAVFVNALSLLWLAPGLLKTLFGIETMFSRSQFSLLNTTVLMIAVGITHLAIGPVTNAFYVLRCFYGRAVYTGDDLKVTIRRLRTLAACFLGALVLWTGGTTQAADPQQLDQSIEQVLTRPEYAWRTPRKAVANSEKAQLSLLAKFSNAVRDAVKACTAPLKKWVKSIGKRVEKWLEKYFAAKREKPEAPPELDWKGAFKQVIYLLCGVVLIAAGVIAWRGWRRRNMLPEMTAEPVQAMPDLRSEHITADELPEDRWIELAEKMAAQGEFRLSLRALYLAGLAHLGTRELVTIAQAKSNKEFRQELNRRARLQTDLITAFGESVSAFESVWYGTAEATPATLEHYTANLQRIRAC